MIYLSEASYRPSDSVSVATNVYFKTAQGWRLVAHHASPGRSEVAEVSQPAQLLH